MLESNSNFNKEQEQFYTQKKVTHMIGVAAIAVVALLVAWYAYYILFQSGKYTNVLRTNEEQMLKDINTAVALYGSTPVSFILVPDAISLITIAEPTDSDDLEHYQNLVSEGDWSNGSTPRYALQMDVHGISAGELISTILEEEIYIQVQDEVTQLVIDNHNKFSRLPFYLRFPGVVSPPPDEFIPLTRTTYPNLHIAHIVLYSELFAHIDETNESKYKAYAQELIEESLSLGVVSKSDVSITQELVQQYLGYFFTTDEYESLQANFLAEIY